MIAAPAAAIKIPRVILRLLRAGLRRVFNLSFLAALSLLLGIGLGCLWVRTMRVDDQLVYTSSRQDVILGTLPGRSYFIVYIRWGVFGNLPTVWYYTSGRQDPEQIGLFLEMKWRHSWLGFDLWRQSHRPSYGELHITAVAIPLWFPMVVTLIAPLCWLRR